MKFTKVLCLLAVCLLALPRASADEWNKKTKVTFTEPIEVPGMVLPAGTYTFALADSLSDRNIVQIWNADQTKLFATILAINNYRLKATDKTVLTFDERPRDTPEALHAWFYPGNQYGQEFVYPKNRALELAKLNKARVLAMPDDLATDVTTPVSSVKDPPVVALEQAPIVAITPEQQEVAVAGTTEVQPETVTSNAAVTLPHTASALPQFVLGGVIGLFAVLMLRAMTTDWSSSKKARLPQQAA